ncbi:uncharacterized protein Z519_12309 [Cladophialophora bantiana CBS 173.52]|uniref:Retrotransposon gag domain-containing protein n=1 Tax=Cladophialophora bantiana (strain ATCC 10958 / CBS 173.52 / CDC B-1940 / NIH 8579) TaxID=1442370 RepID=A0A0D2FK14_CLAB1|nr:uncharacterized protein Z519_12309 [Cladophialophora bantiana CBS 173.52]KIW87012.1 hypothetical protein Z519_12309 [Cladophialophora bantiana CBS 173.52]
MSTTSSTLRLTLSTLRTTASAPPPTYGISVKILFMGSYFEGDAEAWLRPFVKDYMENEGDDREDETINLFETFIGFKETMKLIFRVKNKKKEAQKKIVSLR